MSLLPVNHFKESIQEVEKEGTGCRKTEVRTLNLVAWDDC